MKEEETKPTANIRSSVGETKPTADDKLPVDFPGREVLFAAGLNTAKKVRAHTELGSISGMSAALLEEIVNALKKLPRK